MNARNANEANENRVDGGVFSAVIVLFGRVEMQAVARLEPWQ